MEREAQFFPCVSRCHSREDCQEEDLKKRLEGGDFDMEATVERLKKEKAESGEDFLNTGKVDGLEWAKVSHYLDIQNALKWNPEMGYIPDKEDLREEIITMIKEDPDLGFEEHSWEMTDETTEWAKGWVEGVKEFWNQVAGRI